MSRPDTLLEWTRSLNNLATIGSALGVLATIGLLAGIWAGVNKLAQLDRSIGAVSHELTAARKNSRLIIDLLSSQEDTVIDFPIGARDFEFKTIADAQAKVAQLGNTPKPRQLAEVMYALDGWLIEPEQEEQFQQFKQDQLVHLRKLVKAEVVTLQKEAVNAATGDQGVRKLAEAGSVLQLYPMSEDPTVIEEARRWSERQAKATDRIRVLRRQRYNQWTTGRVEQAIQAYNANVHRYNPFADNGALTDLLVEHLGAVDPALLEPVVLDLYNYIIKRTKGSIPQENRATLAKRLTDPAIRRKTLGDF